MKNLIITALLIFSVILSFSQNVYKYEENGKFGFKKKGENSIVVKAKYDFISDFDDNIAIVFNGETGYLGFPEKGKYGLVDGNGKEISPLIYDKISDFVHDHAKVKKNGKFGFIDNSGKVVIPIIYNSAARISKNYISLYKGKLMNDYYKCNSVGKYGIFSISENKIIIPVVYDFIFAGFMACGCYTRSWPLYYEDSDSDELEYFKLFKGKMVYRNGEYEPGEGKVKIVDTQGNTILPMKYSYIGNFYNGRAIVKLNNKYGAIDTNFKIVIPTSYDLIFEFNSDDKITRAIKNGKYGIIDINGNTIIEHNYDYMSNPRWNNPLSIFNGELSDDGNPKKGLYGLMSLDGKVIVEPKYNFISSYTYNGLHKVFLGELNNYGSPEKGKYGFIDSTGKEVVPVKYNYMIQFQNSLSNDISSISYGSSKYFRAWDGDNHIPLALNDSKFPNGYYKAMSNGKWGILDNNYKEVVPCKYDYIDYFKNGYASTFVGSLDEDKEPLNGKHGLVSIEGKEIISPQYDYVYGFDKGFFKVFKGSLKDNGAPYKGSYGLINKDGKTIVPCNYRYIEIEDNDLIRVFQGSITYKQLDENTYSVEEKGKYGYYNRAGEIIIPCEYEDLRNFDNYIRINDEEKSRIGVYSLKPKKLSPIDFTWVGKESENMLMVYKGDSYSTFTSKPTARGKFGFINLETGDVIECQYPNAEAFDNGYAAVYNSKKGKWGLINKKGELVKRYKYKSVADIKYP